MDGTAAVAPEPNETSIYHGNLAKMGKATTERPDLSARNRLLNVPRFSKNAKTIDVVEGRIKQPTFRNRLAKPKKQLRSDKPFP